MADTAQKMAEKLSEQVAESIDYIEAATRTVDIEIAALADLSKAIATTMREEFSRAVETIKNTTGRVVVTGMGKSGHIARKIAATMASTGTPSHFVHPGEASHGDLGMIAKGDTVIAISNGGESAELADTLNHCKRFAIPLIAVTSRAQSTLGSHGDILLLLPQAPEACPFGMAPTTSTTLTLALGDALSVALMEARGFTKQHYGTLHPGGKLGKALLKAGDLMHKGESLPVVTSGTTLGKALLVMSKGRLGCLCITNENGTLAGIFTDGDLRRALESGTLDTSTATIDSVMTSSPKTLPPSRLAAEAVGFMNEQQITQLVLVEDSKPVGILHLHDLIRAGIA